MYDQPCTGEHWGQTPGSIPECEGREGIPGESGLNLWCSYGVVGAKCEELVSEGKECEPVCEVKVRPAGWGRARSPGFDRISLENVMCREGNTATWQLWLAILALYLGHWAAYRIVDAHDEEATETIRAAAEDAPPHHYAVATTGLPENLREPASLRWRHGTTRTTLPCAAKTPSKNASSAAGARRSARRPVIATA